jgi:hypothetical protein
MVRKIVAYELLSLDGVAEQPDEFVGPRQVPDRSTIR